MRPLTALLLWGLTIAAAAACVALPARNATLARRDTGAAREHLGLVRARCSELACLRAQAEPGPEPGRAASGLQPRIAAVLASCALPPATLAALAPENAAPIASARGPSLKRQRATLTLTPVTLPQAGSFLDAWRRAEPRWTIAGIDLSPVAARPAGASRGAQPAGESPDLPLRAVVVLEAVFSDEPEPPPEPATPMSSLMPRNP